MKELLKSLVGSQSLSARSAQQILSGLRRKDQRELLTGLGLAAVALFRRSKPEKELIYRKKVRPGSAVVISNRRHGDPKIEIVKPD